MPAADERFEEVEIGKVEVIKTTDRAILVRPNEGKDSWVPRSQICRSSEITSDAEEGDEGVLVLPRWLADKEF